MTSNTPEPRTWDAFGRITSVLTTNGEPRLTTIKPTELQMRLYNGGYVKLLLKEDENGEYYGWLPADLKTGVIDESHMVMVTYHLFFDINFPDGWKKTQEAGRGKAVRVRAEIIS